MNYLTVNYGLNQSYSVNTTALEELINYCIKDIKGLKVDGKIKLTFTKDQQNVAISFNFKIKQNKNIAEIVNNFANDLEKKFILLLGLKPTNLQMNFVGFY